MENKRKKLDFYVCDYDYYLTRSECDEFIDAVVRSAFPIFMDDNGVKTTDYDPLSKITAIKMNIIRFYGNVDFKNMSTEDLYSMCADINIEGFKSQEGLNKEQFESILDSIDEKCEYFKQQLLFSSINNESITELIRDYIDDKFSVIQPVLDSLSELDVDVMRKMLEKIANGDFDIDERKVVDIITNSPEFQKHQDDTVSRLHDVIKDSKKKEGNRKTRRFKLKKDEK